MIVTNRSLSDFTGVLSGLEENAVGESADHDERQDAEDRERLEQVDEIA